jgi:hypothetical protein
VNKTKVRHHRFAGAIGISGKNGVHNFTVLHGELRKDRGTWYMRWRLCFTELCSRSKKPRMVCSSTILCDASAIAR